jgi:hypothetical protein
MAPSGTTTFDLEIDDIIEEEGDTLRNEDSILGTKQFGRE